jgi:serine/threonine protein kinase
VIEPGTKLGAYEILTLIGVGGMGEVYRARDTRLGPDVALKILPSTFTQDAERIARFKREAQMLASLSHPNIAGIYGLDEAEGQQFLALELVEGETLAAKLTRSDDRAVPKRGLPVDEALALARQIADALEAAHEKGIIHRDLKPANIAVTDEGVVKVLDFGLAKALETTTSSELSMSPTLTFAATQAGVILGTAAYMSPEQAKGRGADKRSDVWSFGCVLYEMLAGKRPFEGEDVSDTLAAVLRADPDWAALPKSLPASTELLVRRCLERDRRRRIGDVSTIRFLLDEQGPAFAAPRATGQPESAGRFRSAKSAVAAGVLAIVGAVLGASIAWNMRPASTPPIVTRFPVALGEGQQFTNGGDQVIAISPDGTKIAYAANRRLYLRSMSDLGAQPIRGTDVNPRRPMFSPDSASLAFFSPDDRALKRIAISGGAPVTVTSLDSPNAPYGGTWTGDFMVFGLAGGSHHGVVRVPAGGGTLDVIAKINADEYAAAPQLLPDGEHLLFTLGSTTTRGIGGGVTDRWDRAKIVVQALRTGERKTIVDGGSDGRYVNTGHLLYALGGVVYAVRFDLSKLQVIGGPIPVVEGVLRAAAGNTGNSGAAQFSVSGNGSLVYVPGPVSLSGAQNILAMIDRQGTIDPLKLPPGGYRDPRFSPDGKQLAVVTDDGKEAVVWVYDLSGATSMRRLTLAGSSRYPVWSPNGQRIAFQSERDGDVGVFSQLADGSGVAERLTKPEQGVAYAPESWAPDGKRLFLSATTASTVTSVTFSLDDRKITPFGGIRSSQPINATFSPDGKWVAYTSRAIGGASTIYVQPFPPTGASYQISKPSETTAHHPLWSRDGRELYYIPGQGRFAVVSVTTQPAFTFSDPVALPRGTPSFFEGGPLNTRQNDVGLDHRVVGVFPGAPGAAVAFQEYRVVLNWFEELKSRVPVR